MTGKQAATTIKYIVTGDLHVQVSVLGDGNNNSIDDGYNDIPDDFIVNNDNDDKANENNDFFDNYDSYENDSDYHKENVNIFYERKISN